MDKPTKGYLPFKNIVPHIMKDKVEDWRRWRNKFLVYVEYVTLGMKKMLEEVQKMEQAPWTTFATDKAAEYSKAYIFDVKEKIYRALQELTDACEWWRRCTRRMGTVPGMSCTGTSSQASEDSKERRWTNSASS